MMTVCMICQVVIKEWPGKGISHGYCELHGLEILEKENMITLDEQRQLNAMRFERRKETMLDKGTPKG